MISSKLSISQVFATLRKQDYIIHPARSFSVTSALGRKINTRRPRPPCYERALINAICKVKYAPNLEHLLPTNQRCQRSTSKQWLLEKKGLNEENLYENILAKEVLELFQKNKMIAIVHRHSMVTETLHEVKLALKRAGMQLRDQYGRRTIEKALTNTKYISIMPLFKIREGIILSPEVHLDALLKILKKSPQITLMALIVEGQLLSKSQAEFYASTNLATQQAQLVHTINSVASSLASQLNHHASTLVSRLDQHVAGDNSTPEIETSGTGEPKPESTS